MSKKSDQRDLEWARAQFPLLARRSDAEVLRLVKEARDQLGVISKFTGVGGAGLGFLLGFWMEQRWLPEAFSGPVEAAIPIVASVLVGYASGIASEQLVRRRVEAIVRAPVKRY